MPGNTYQPIQVWTENIWVFFGITVLISLSGVMTPGPVFAATIAKGYKDEKAGIKIALGHGLVEFPLMALIVLSLGYVFEDSRVQLAIGLIGGVLLIFLGLMMIKSRKLTEDGPNTHLNYSSFITGALTTSANPYFFLWWATVGSLLIMKFTGFGVAGLGAMVIVHWLCDLVWLSFVSILVYRTHSLWGRKFQEGIFIGCSLLLVGFGGWFLVSGIKLVV